VLRTERLRKITFYKSNLEKCLLKPVLTFISVVCYREDNGEKYKVGETFTTRNCSETCWCNENGEITCVPLCSKIKCPRGFRPKRRAVINVGEENECSCESQECVPGTSACFFYTFNKYYSKSSFVYNCSVFKTTEASKQSSLSLLICLAV